MPEGASDLIRAVRSYFRFKGQALDTVPVVVIDDNSKGPFPPYRAWYGGAILAGVAAQYAYGWVTNEDGKPGQIAPAGPGKSAVIVDEIFAVCTTAVDDYFISMSKKGSPAAPAVTALANDAAQEKVLDEPVTNPQFGNVTINQVNQPGQLWGNNSQRFPGGALGIVTRIPGPFVLGPQGVLAINPATLANSMLVFFRGRYYSAI
jgi:hypothetical protein